MPLSIIPLTLIQNNHTYHASMCLAKMSLNDLENNVDLDSLLHIQEKKLLDTLNFPRRKASYLIGRYCAKNALRYRYPAIKMNQVLIQRGVFDQPVIYGAGIVGTQVSISHTEEFGAALVFDESHPMAIDIEVSQTTHTETIKNLLTESEISLLAKHQGLFKEGFFNKTPYSWIWTAKESLSKVLRTGLTVEMSIYEVKNLCFEEPYLIGYFTNFPQYKSVSFIWHDVIVTIAMPVQSSFEMTS